ncbi:MAG: glycoside hydrolase family 3 C-terminal domain-containing protein [Alicyclobacillus sp.]|nr:glycoside hydrolase family 3 C-terminal domain-containing protein [Alicyclobacillus sp.]
MEKYKDPHASLEARIDDLLSRMTLKEKVGQLNQKMFGWHAYEKTENGIELTAAFREEVAFGDGIGALYGLFRADPWSRVSFHNGIPPEDCPKITNRIQRYVLENTRLGIPVLFSEECPHGHQALDGTMLPVNLGVGSTWNPSLYEAAFSHVAAEIRAKGAHLGLVSALDILRDPRWGRAEECFSEDPYLASQMTRAVVRGLQGNTLADLRRQDKIVAVLKHFCAQGTPVGGHNAWPANIGERELREIFLPGMQSGIAAGAIACMAAYNEIDGIPCHANRKLLTEILREEMGFDGIVMSDGQAVDMLRSMTGGDYESAVCMAVTAGVDLNLWNEAFLHLENAVRSGRLQETWIDQAVRRVLRVKFLLGLFDNPFTDEARVVQVVRSESSKDLNLQVARESIVLLKNANHLLPLSKAIGRIAVIGPNADALYNQLGDYTPPQREGSGVTVLQGIRSIVSEGTKVVYHRGCGIRDASREGFAPAIQAARESDVAIVVVGGSSARDFGIQFEGNGAAKLGEGSSWEMDCGEGVDVADLELGGVQVDLVKEIVATGTPVVVVLIQGRPHAIPWIAEHCDAIVCGWYPGSLGGRAIAEVLFGDVNPSGKLPVSIPRSSAQLPIYYNVKNVHRTPYVDMSSEPLYPFGFGLSYSTFEYSHLRVEPETLSLHALHNGSRFTVLVDICNSGSIGGDETVQLYIQDLEASITRRTRELKGFEKVHLAPGETRTVKFSLGFEELAIWNPEMKYVVEPGHVAVYVGAASTTENKVRIQIIDA